MIHVWEIESPGKFDSLIGRGLKMAYLFLYSSKGGEPRAALFRQQDYLEFQPLRLSHCRLQVLFWTNCWVVPRMSFPPVEISEINYFEGLHGEMFITMPPEEICRELKDFFK